MIEKVIGMGKYLYATSNLAKPRFLGIVNASFRRWNKNYQKEDTMEKEKKIVSRYDLLKEDP